MNDCSQMDAASLPQIKMIRAIDAIGARVAPALRQHEVELARREGVRRVDW
jgi:hypothetical protein